MALNGQISPVTAADEQTARTFSLVIQICGLTDRFRVEPEKHSTELQTGDGLKLTGPNTICRYLASCAPSKKEALLGKTASEAAMVSLCSPGRLACSSQTCTLRALSSETAGGRLAIISERDGLQWRTAACEGADIPARRGSPRSLPAVTDATQCAGQSALSQQGLSMRAPPHTCRSSGLWRSAPPCGAQTRQQSSTHTVVKLSLSDPAALIIASSK